MKFSVVYPKGKSEPWADEVVEGLIGKVNPIISISDDPLQSRKLSRSDSKYKIQIEGELILKALKDTDFVIALGEKGRKFSDSVAFSDRLVKKFDGGHKRIVFVLGGPYGLDEAVYQRAEETWSLSTLTFNHHLARVALFEQIYRGLSIWKGLPYHNA